MIRTIRWLLILAAAIPLGCATTPTVPVPPPELTQVSSPDPDGRTVVRGPAGTAEQDDIVLVFNYDSGLGVMLRVENEDGSFEVEVTAAVGDELLVQIKRDNRLSLEEGRIVPQPEPDTNSTP